MPRGALNEGLQYRVLIRQYELLAPDPDPIDPPSLDPGVLPLDRRIIFAAEFVLARGA